MFSCVVPINAVGKEISACGVSQLKLRSILTPILMSF